MSDAQIRVEIAEVARGKGLVEAQLCGPAHSLYTVCQGPFPSHMILAIQAPSFELYVGFREGGAAFITRNDRTVTITPDQDKLISLLFSWGPNELSITTTSLGTGNPPVVARVETRNTLPPVALYNWLKKRSFQEREGGFADSEELLNEVKSQFLELQTKVGEHAMWAACWSGSGENRKPRTETELQPIISSMLDHLECMRQVTFTRESLAGAGRIDFLFSAQRLGGGFVHVCAEVKLAHATNLLHGLSSQLPEYMQSKRAECGLFVVLDFGPGYTPDLSKAVIRGLPRASELSLEVLLSLLAEETGRKISYVILDLSKPPAPSRA